MSPPTSELPCPIKGCRHTRRDSHAFCRHCWTATPPTLRAAVIRAWQARRYATTINSEARAKRVSPVMRERYRAGQRAAMRAHLQAIEEAMAAVEKRDPVDLFAVR